MEGPLLRFSTAEARPRAEARDGAAGSGDDDGCGALRPPGPGFYDDSEAKLANRQEERHLAAAIEGISLDRYRTATEMESGRKTVKRGFQKILSQQQLLDVARAENVVGPRHRSSGDAPQSFRQRSPQRPGSRKTAQQPSSSARQHLHLSPSSPNFSPKFHDNKRPGRNVDGDQEQGMRSYDGFHGSRPRTSGGRRVTGPQHGRSTWEASGGAGLTAKPNSRDGLMNNSRARTAHEVRQRSASQSTPKPVLSQNQCKQAPTSGGQIQPAQTRSIHTGLDTDDTDEVATQQTQRRRANSAFGLDQARPRSPCNADGTPDSLADARPRRHSNSNQGRPCTAGGGHFHGRSRRELSRLTHIDAITAAEMALRRRLWLAHQESKSHVGDAALQQRVQEFLAKLDKAKKDRQQLMSKDIKGRQTEEHLVLPAV